MKVKWVLTNITFSFTIILFISMILPLSMEATTIKLRVIVQFANIRSGPSLESTIVSKAPLGAILYAEEKAADWYKIKLSKAGISPVVFGYIYQDLVEIVNEPEDSIEQETQQDKKPEKKAYIEPVPANEGPKNEREILRSARKELPSSQKLRFSAGGGFGFATGDWSEIYSIGFGFNGSLLYGFVPSIDLVVGADLFFFPGESSLSLIRISPYISGRYNYQYTSKVGFFGEFGLGSYSDVVMYKGESETDTVIGFRLGGGVHTRTISFSIMYHNVSHEAGFHSFIFSAFYRF